MDVVVLRPQRAFSGQTTIELWDTLSKKLVAHILSQHATLAALFESVVESEHVEKLVGLAQRHLTIPPTHVLAATAQNMAVKNAQSFTIHYAVQFALHLVLRFAPASSTLPPTMRLAIYLVRLAVRQVATIAARVALGRILAQLPARQLAKIVHPISRRALQRLPALLSPGRVM